MRTSLRALAAASMATIGLLTLAPSPARAAIPAPVCESGASSFFCGSANAGQTTWTLTFYYATAGPVTTQWRTPEPKVSAPCYNYNLTILVRYSHDPGGQSPTTAFYCNPGAWP